MLHDGAAHVRRAQDGLAEVRARVLQYMVTSQWRHVHSFQVFFVLFGFGVEMRFWSSRLLTISSPGSFVPGCFAFFSSDGLRPRTSSASLEASSEASSLTSVGYVSAPL